MASVRIGVAVVGVVSADDAVPFILTNLEGFFRREKRGKDDTN